MRHRVFFQQPTQEEAPPQGSLLTKSQPSFGYDAHGRISSVTDANGVTFQLTRDDAGRVTESHGPTGHTTWLYANAASTVPSAMVRNGVTFTITQTSAHGVFIHKMSKYITDSNELNSINGGGDWFDGCASDPNCGGRPFDWSWSDFIAWANAGGIVGGATGFWVAYNSGADAAVMADFIAIYGAVGAMVGGAWYGGFQFGTWAYNNYGAYWWIRYAP